MRAFIRCGVQSFSFALKLASMLVGLFVALGSFTHINSPHANAFASNRSPKAKRYINENAPPNPQRRLWVRGEGLQFRADGAV